MRRRRFVTNTRVIKISATPTELREQSAAHCACSVDKPHRLNMQGMNDHNYDTANTKLGSQNRAVVELSS